MESNEKNVVTREFVLAVVKQNGGWLKYASRELQADREVVLAAVGQYGRALKYAAPELQADREVVLAAVGQDGWALEFAAPELQAALVLQRSVSPTPLPMSSRRTARL